MAVVHFSISRNERVFCCSPLLLIRPIAEVLHIYNHVQSLIRLFLHSQIKNGIKKYTVFLIRTNSQSIPFLPC